MNYRASEAYAPLDDRCLEIDGDKTWRQVLAGELDEAIVVAIDSAGKPHELVPRRMAQEVLVKKGMIERPVHGPGPSMKDAFDDKVLGEAARRTMAAAADAANEQFTALTKVMLPDFITPLCRMLLDEFWADVLKKVLARRKAAAGGGASGETLEDVAAKLTKAEQLGLLAELCVCKSRATSFYGKPDDKELLDALGVDAAKIEKQVRAELKAKKGAKE